MNVRHKLISLHVTFAAFAVGVAGASIYGVQVHVQGVMNNLERFVDSSNLVDHLRVESQGHFVQLNEILNGHQLVDADFIKDRDALFAQLSAAAHFTGFEEGLSNRRHLLRLGKTFRDQSDRCLELIAASRLDEARKLLREEIGGVTLAGIDRRLKTAKRYLDESRRDSVDRVLTMNAQLLWLSVVIGAGCVGFLVVGAGLVRRWLISPITVLRKATQELGRGNLAYRVHMNSGDELGTLGAALNNMASSLHVSQAKYRSLFENLRDAVIICDATGRVIECRDSDTGILDIPSEGIEGRRLGDIWPAGGSTSLDWGRIVKNVLRDGNSFRANDVVLGSGSEQEKVADIIAYPIEFGNSRHVAVVTRDATERHRLHRLSRRAETIEAASTFARGVAHDFKNLLNSAVTTLSLMGSETGDDRNASRIRTALHACEQAASLSRKLVSFASPERDTALTIQLSETVELILDSLDELFLEKMRLQTQLDSSAVVKMEKDQLTQIILNLIHNAHDAMPDGGSLRISVTQRMAVDPLRGGEPSLRAVLEVTDTGCGMSAEVLERLFEPLFSTKPRNEYGLRGMGLAVVYAAVKNAGGFVQVESKVGAGTTFKVFLPLAPESIPDGAATSEHFSTPATEGATGRHPSPRH